MMTIIILAAAFVGVAALVGGVAVMLRAGGESTVEDRLEMLTGAKSAAAMRGGKQDQASLLSSPLDGEMSTADRIFQRFFNLQRLLQQADVNLSASKLLLIMCALAGAGAAVCIFARWPLYIAPVLGLVLAALPLAWLVFKRKRRMGAFAKQLPEALELIARALRAGHSLAAGFHLAASEMADPIGKEFQKVYEEQNLGIPLEEALEAMTDRVPNLDLRFFATAVILQRQTGGDLAEILDKIGHLVRERFRIFGQIQALTGEGRLSGVVLLALPPVLFVAIWRLNPKYVEVLFTDPMGRQMLFFGVIMQIIGAWVIKKIIDIKV